MAKQIWSLDDLPDLRIGDNLAFRAEGIERPMMKLIGADTFHWAMAGAPVCDDSVSEKDYSVFDSTAKGITAHLLSEYQCRHMRVYRPKMGFAIYEKLREPIIKRYLYYGDQLYDWKGVGMVSLWCLLHKFGFQVEWWEHNSHRFWCLEFNEIILRDLWKPLVPIIEPPYPKNMENSPLLEKIWGTF